MAGSTLIAIPVVIFFLIVQGRMVGGPDRRGGEGMTALDAAPRWRLRVLLPASPARRCRPRSPAARRPGLGGVCLFGTNTADGPDAVAAYTADVRAGRPGAVVAVDEEGGDVTRLHARTAARCSAPLALGAPTTSTLTRAVGGASAVELAVVGITLDLGPVADVNTNADNPVIGTRSFGADPRPARARRRVDSRAPGGGVAACAKHFPGHGDTAEDSHLALPVRRRRHRRRWPRASWCRSRPRSRPARRP